jgi:hypothetical protein
VEHTINVRQDHITRGVRYSVVSCPIALAAMEQLGLDDITIFGLSIRYGKIGGDRRWTRLPLDVYHFIEQFDAGKPVKPFSFIVTFVEVPQEKTEYIYVSRNVKMDQLTGKE